MATIFLNVMKKKIELSFTCGNTKRYVPSEVILKDESQSYKVVTLSFLTC